MSPELPISSHLCIRESIYGTVMIKLMTVNGHGENNFGRQMGNAMRGLTSVKCFREVLKPCHSENSISRKCCQTGFQVRVSSNIYIAKKLVLLGLGTMGAFFCFHESDNSLQLSNRRCFFKKELGQLDFKLNQETSGRGTENFIR